MVEKETVDEAGNKVVEKEFWKHYDQSEDESDDDDEDSSSKKTADSSSEEEYSQEDIDVDELESSRDESMEPKSSDDNQGLNDEEMSEESPETTAQKPKKKKGLLSKLKQGGKKILKHLGKAAEDFFADPSHPFFPSIEFPYDYAYDKEDDVYFAHDDYLGITFKYDANANKHFYYDEDENCKYEWNEKSREWWKEGYNPLDETMSASSKDDPTTEIVEDNNKDVTNENSTEKVPESLFTTTTCLLPEEPSTNLIVNTTGKTMKKQLKKGGEIYEIAPGECKRPNNWLKDENFDITAFPDKFCDGRF